MVGVAALYLEGSEMHTICQNNFKFLQGKAGQIRGFKEMA
jgi:hypothetical protein